MSGWVKIHRSLREHFLYSFDEPEKSLAWIDILLSVNHSDTKVMIKAQSIIVLRGQMAVSQVSLQKRWKWSQNKVKRFLKLLKKEGMIDFEANELTTLITVCNYDDYQGDGRAGERSDGRPDERGADDQTNDKQECKEEKECKEKRNNTSAKSPEISFKFSDDDLLLAGYMFEKIIEIFPDEKKPNLEQWAEHIRLTRERDKRTHKEILKLFTWCNEHSFHAQNVRSPKKLRDKWADLSAGRISEDRIYG